jgi:Cytochrome C oxidase, cbb3-type, subunit III
MRKVMKGLTIFNLLIVLTTSAQSEGIDAGKKEYMSSCAACHGADGKGKGPLSEELKTPPGDLTTLARRNNGVFPVNTVYETIDGRKAVTSHGTREMPIWGDLYTPFPNISPNQYSPKPTESYVDLSYDPEAILRTRILALIDYLNRIQQK